MAPAETRKKLVKKACKMMKPMAHLGCVPCEEEMTTTDGERLKLTECWGTNLDKKIEEWVFNLFNENMYEMYKISQWGYDPSSKKAELFSTTSRFILVETEENGLIGYVHYRFVLDHDFPVVYCYELQVKESQQQKGIGSLLMRILEEISQKSGMSKTMATIFAHNPKSLGFFHKNGYTEDESCPTEESGLDYVILSKPIV